MSTTTRTDIHRPSAPEFNPADYEYTGALFDLGSENPGANAYELKIRADYKAQGYTDSVPAYQCTHCGARLRYSAMMAHKPTRTLAYIGEICLDGRFSETQEDFREAHRRAAWSRKQQKQLKSFLAECKQYPSLIYASYAANIKAAADKRELWGKTLDILGDIADRARVSGKPLSWKQAALLDKLMGDLDEQSRRHAVRKAKWAAEVAARTDAFIGEIGDRCTFTGTVRVCKEFDTDYGVSTLLIVDTPEGTVKWFASGARDYEREEELTFKATVKAHEFDQYDGMAVTVVTRGAVQ